MPLAERGQRTGYYGLAQFTYDCAGYISYPPRKLRVSFFNYPVF
jgi:hypothetical protein